MTETYIDDSKLTQDFKNIDTNYVYCQSKQAFSAYHHYFQFLSLQKERTFKCLLQCKLPILKRTGTKIIFSLYNVHHQVRSFSGYKLSFFQMTWILLDPLRWSTRRVLWVGLSQKKFIPLCFTIAVTNLQVKILLLVVDKFDSVYELNWSQGKPDFLKVFHIPKRLSLGFFTFPKGFPRVSFP